MNRLIIAVVAAGLILIAACDTTGIPSDDFAGESLIPLEIGNQWIWRTTEQSFVDGWQDSTYVDTTRVVADVLLDDERWYQLRTNGEEALATNRPSGYWKSGPGGIGAHLVYQYPAEVGDTFPAISAHDSSYVRVMSLDTTITVPAGTFQAVHYAQITAITSGLSFACNFFVAPQVGLVKKQLPWIDMAGEIVRVDTQELVEFVRK